MQFYLLTSPREETDWEHYKRNPVENKRPSYVVPLIVCEECGVWGDGGAVLRMESVPPALRDEFSGYPQFPRLEWVANRPRWAKLLGVAEDVLSPAQQVGPPHGELLRSITEDMVHVGVGAVWCRSRVRDVVLSAGLSGVEFWPVDLVWAPKAKTRNRPLQELWEVYAIGQAQRPRAADKRPICPLCGRRKGPEGPLEVDAWDGTDFFHLDGNKQGALVTERVAQLFAEHGFSNYACIPISEIGNEGPL